MTPVDHDLHTRALIERAASQFARHVQAMATHAPTAIRSVTVTISRLDEISPAVSVTFADGKKAAAEEPPMAKAVGKALRPKRKVGR